MTRGNYASVPITFVAASDASSRARDFAWARCDGTADDVEIQAAIDALPSGGGKVMLSEGTFTLTAQLARAIDNVSIEGQGAGTQLNFNASTAVISAGSQTAWDISRLNTDAGGVDISSASESAANYWKSDIWTTVGSSGNVAGADYTIFVEGSTYFSKQRNGNVPVTSTTLTDITDDIETNGGSNTSIHFASGTFNFGAANWTFRDLDDLVISGEGIGITIISNSSSDAADTEPLSFTRCNRVVVRDMTISAGGNARSTSDALDFDDCSDCLVERVKISASRARGIVFDGKDDVGGEPPALAIRNVIRDCIITGTQGLMSGDGICLLAAGYTDIVNCHIYDTAQHGIQIAKASSGADQANKKSTHNRVIGGSIKNAGKDGINILSSDFNTILGVHIENSGDDTDNRSGVRIETANNITADHNKISVTAIDSEPSSKTQNWGVNIDPAGSVVTEANDNLIIGCVVDGNDTAGIKDNGNRTIIRDNQGFAASGDVVTIKLVIDHAALTDNGDATAYMDMADTIPAGSIIKAVKCDFTEAWNSDETSSLKMMLGIPTDLDDFSKTSTPGFDIHDAAGVDTFWSESACRDPLVVAAVIPRVTFTEDDDATDIISSGANRAGGVTITITYMKA